MINLNKLNGWQRIVIVVSFFWIIGSLFFFIKDYPTYKSPRKLFGEDVVSQGYWDAIENYIELNNIKIINSNIKECSAIANKIIDGFGSIHNYELIKSLTDKQKKDTDAYFRELSEKAWQIYQESINAHFFSYFVIVISVPLIGFLLLLLLPWIIKGFKQKD